MNNLTEWVEFQRIGLLWFVNRIIHIFGYAIIFNYDKDNILVSVYPKKVSYRGFKEYSEQQGFEKVMTYMKENIDEIVKPLNSENEERKS